jgi:hypothetical protein
VNEKGTKFKLETAARETVIQGQLNLCTADLTYVQGAIMTQAQHYRFQADQANRLAHQVTDSDVRQRLLEMAGEYSRYAELMEAREAEAF